MTSHVLARRNLWQRLTGKPRWCSRCGRQVGCEQSRCQRAWEH